MLPAVVRFNAREPEVREIYQQLALQAGLVEAGQNGSSGAMALAEFDRLPSPGGLARLAGRRSVEAGGPGDLGRRRRPAVDGRFQSRPVTAVDFVDPHRLVLESNDARET